MATQAAAAFLGTLASLALALPTAAQQAALDRQQVELYAEMLAMGEVCGDLADYDVLRPELESWMTGELAQAAEADLDSVIDLRDAKLASLRSAVAAAREAPAGRRRADAIDEYYESLFGRCNRLTGDSVASAWFVTDSRVAAARF